MSEMRIYESFDCQDIEEIIKGNIRTIDEKMGQIASLFITNGYYLRRQHNEKMYEEEGYEKFEDYVKQVYGKSRTWATRMMQINEKFSEGGNSPKLDEKYVGFDKSQLQEMLYLTEEQLESVSPDMTVKEIRKAREPEKLSAYGTKKKEYPKDSLCATEGCEGGHNCSCCTKECEIRQEERYCEEAPMGNPFPCTTMYTLDMLKEEIGVKCQFINQELAYKRLGDGEASPCCKECDNPCGNECSRSAKARHEKEKELCDVAQKEPVQEEQIPGQMTVEDYPELMPDDTEDVQQADVIDAEYREVVEEEQQEEGNTNYSEMRLAKDLLEKEQKLLTDILQCYTDSDEIARKQKIKVAALASYVCELDDILNRPELPEPEQPELPLLKNNEERKEWLRDYESWGIWYEDEHIGCKYYKYDFENGARLIAEVYTNTGNKYIGEYESSHLHLVGGPESPKGKYGVTKWNNHKVYSKHPNGETELVEFLKYIQRKEK